jgi:hypothetical protein
LEKIFEIIISHKIDLIMLVVVGLIFAGYKIFSAIRKGKNKNDNGQNT